MDLHSLISQRGWIKPSTSIEDPRIARILAAAEKASETGAANKLFANLTLEHEKLCASCQNIVILDSVFQSIDLGTVRYVWDNSHQGCMFCNVVAIAFDFGIFALDSKAWDDTLFLNKDKEKDVLGCIQIRDGFVVGEVELLLTRSMTESEQKIFPQSRIPFREISSNPDSPETFRLIEDWLSACIKEHSCKVNDYAALPTRLIDVAGTDSDRIRLVSLPSEDVQDHRYIALSYCWGDSTPFMTTTSTLQNRHEGFLVAEMPRTLRDAVRVTRELRCQYLWIDALCIIQGSDKAALADWEVESSRMENVYGNAYLTIAAAASNDCDGGIFYPRSCRLPFYIHEGDAESKGTITVVAPQANRRFKDEPLNSRAWALQERLLSSRILTYSLDEVSMQCNDCLVREFPVGDDDIARRWHKIYKFRFPVTIQPTGEHWFLVVENYCSRNLTNSDDKLPAIAGLARRFERLTQGSYGRYLAGHWENDLFQSILWCRHTAFSGVYAQPRIGMPKKYRAPSWSWACIDGVVSYIIARKLKALSHTVAKIVECTTSTIQADPFSMVLSGRLVVRGPVRTGSSYQSAVGSECGVWFDDSDDVSAQKIEHISNFYSLLIYAMGEYYGLLLIEAPRQKTFYIRIGIFYSSDKEWWEGAAEETLTII